MPGDYTGQAPPAPSKDNDGRRFMILVLSYANVGASPWGGARRVNELLKALDPDAWLLQPAPPHPGAAGSAFPFDLGRRKLGINWGIFNFFWPPTARRVRALIRDRAPRAIVLTSIWGWAALRGLPSLPPVWLDAQNVDALTIAERFGRHHPFTRLVAAWERGVLARMRGVFTCSQTDADIFTQWYGLPRERLIVVPNGVDTARFARPATVLAPDIEAAVSGRQVLLFMGKPDYQPNREALAFLRGQVWPELERRRPGRFALLICGGQTRDLSDPARLQAGRVPDIVPCLHRADMCLAPLFSGSGTRLKILEYWAAGRPVVATTKAAEGLEARDDVHLRLAAPTDFATAILRLDETPAEARRLAEAGRALVVERYDWAPLRARWRAALSVGVTPT